MCFAGSPQSSLDHGEFDDLPDLIDEWYDESASEHRQDIMNKFIETYRAKWLLDGSKTIPDMIAKLKREAERLEILHEQGWKLQDELLDDYGLLEPPDLEQQVEAAMQRLQPVQE